MLSRGWERCRWLLGLALSCWSLACSGAAQQAQVPIDETEPSSDQARTFELPDSPAGERLAWWLGQLESGGATLDQEQIEARFTDSFLEAVPPEQIIQSARSLAGLLNPFQIIGFDEPPAPNVLTLLIESADGMPFRLMLATRAEPPHLITGLALSMASERVLDDIADFEALLDSLSSSAPAVTFLAAELLDGACVSIATLNEDRPHPIGSAFKLWILLALAERVISGERSWDEPLPILDELRSLPSGRMQTEPTGTTFSAREYAELMISISDNTATDHLLFSLGREAVEEAMAANHHQPSLNLPMLSTREFFALKLMLTADQREAYLSADEAGRRALLDDEIRHRNVVPLIWFVSLWTAPILTAEVEWFASSEDICQTFSALSRLSQTDDTNAQVILEVLSINPGTAFDQTLWPYIGYKGGSEPGVLYTSWLLQRSDGRWFALVAGMHDQNQGVEIDPFLLHMIRASYLLAEVP